MFVTLCMLYPICSQTASICHHCGRRKKGHHIGPFVRYICENVAASLGDQGVMVHIASFSTAFALFSFQLHLSIVLHLSYHINLGEFYNI